MNDMSERPWIIGNFGGTDDDDQCVDSGAMMIKEEDVEGLGNVLGPPQLEVEPYCRQLEADTPEQDSRPGIITLKNIIIHYYI